MVKFYLALVLPLTFASARFERMRRAADIDDIPAMDGDPCVPSYVYASANARTMSQSQLRDFYGKTQCYYHRGGDRKKRIVNGRRANAGQWPWMVSLQLQNDRGNSYCGGVLMNKRFVVTAQHCTTPDDASVYQPSDIKITAGSLRISPPDSSAQHFEAEEIIAHPTADIAIIRLNESASLNQVVWPIWFHGNDTSEKTSQLWGPNHLGQDEEGEAMVAGWGRMNGSIAACSSNDLLYAPILVRHDAACLEWYMAGSLFTNGMLDRMKPYDSLNEICAGGKCPNSDPDCAHTDTCQGDSGGPLMYKVFNHWVLLGVTSRGKGCATCDIPGIYTWTHSLQKWIEANIRLSEDP